MGEPQIPHFHDFGICEPVAKPHNQLSLFLETPGHLKQNKKNTQFQHFHFYNSRSFETPDFGHENPFKNNSYILNMGPISS